MAATPRMRRTLVKKSVGWPWSRHELAESELAWQAYCNGQDPGVSASELKAELLGNHKHE